MRVLGLWLLATWCAECVWGGFTVDGYPMVMLFLGPLYGSVAVLIREVARRRGGGWPVMILLAAAFGVVQAGVVDLSLFDRAGLAGTEFAEWNRAAGQTSVPVFGFSAEQLFEFVRNHVWLSVCAPIAVVEACTGESRRHAPWLTRRTIPLLVVLYVVSSLLIRSDSWYPLSPAQWSFVVVVAGSLIMAAVVWPRWRRESRAGGARRGVGPLALGGIVLVVQLASWFTGVGWAGLWLRVVALVVVIVLAVRWAVSRRHVLAVWGAGLVVAAGGAFLSPPYEAAAPWLMVVSDVFGAVLVVTLLGVAWRRSSRSVRGIAVLSR
ncbi:hypothetical protein [Actinoplanes utahensis]|uniref:hypothetical protein n=1 Tax=Actinoplanes utahensis TaxID=1869 RepID=UPI001269D41D|nr:hypothetical protein [Actinoplanes utahensis]GIF33848.1 hypothetical protein Aut01nite_68340 [Actinoplanes utahensis]